MILEFVLPALGGVGLAGAIGGTTSYLRHGSKWLPASQRWEKDFNFHREALVRMVNGTYEGSLEEALKQQIDLLQYGGKPVRGYERVDEGQTPVPLTAVMEVDKYDGTVEWIVPFYERDSHFSVMTKYALDVYLQPIQELRDSLDISFMGLSKDDPARKAVAVFIQEHAAHLLLNFRPSAREKKRFTEEETAKSILRQRRLVTTLEEATRKAQKANRKVTYINGYDGLEEAKSLAATIAQSSVKGGKAVKEIEAAPPPAPAAVKPDPELSTYNRQALTEEEVAVIALYDSKKRSLPDEDRRLAQSLLLKMYSAVELAVKAESFSDAARSRTVTLANQNRIYASTELDEILRASDGLTSEEAEAIHALRLDNKYLAARKGENQKQKEITNA